MKIKYKFLDIEKTDNILYKQFKDDDEWEIAS